MDHVENACGKGRLVTGGSRGIGAAIARALAKNGADVAISYASAKDRADAVVQELKALGVRAKAFQADQGNTDEVGSLIAAVGSHFGRVDILVNNAGVLVMGQFHDRANNLAELDRMFDVNVRGVADTRLPVAAPAPLYVWWGELIHILYIVTSLGWFAGSIFSSRAFG